MPSEGVPTEVGSAPPAARPCGCPVARASLCLTPLTSREGAALREYIGFIWIGDDPGTRLRILAESLAGAQRQVEEKYGEGHVVSLWNEDDASAPR